MTTRAGLITPHFHVDEFAQPARHGFVAVPYPPPLLPTLRRLCSQLEIIRHAALGGLIILSGYRSPAYNRAIGGALHSQHMLGTAADITCPTRDALDLYALIRGLTQLGELTIGGLGRYPSFVHVDVRPGKLTLWSGSRTTT